VRQRRHYVSNMQYLIITGEASISDKSVVSEEAAVTSRWWETAEHKRSRFRSTAQALPATKDLWHAQNTSCPAARARC
jgi:hypothetical protein